MQRGGHLLPLLQLAVPLGREGVEPVDLPGCGRAGGAQLGQRAEWAVRRLGLARAGRGRRDGSVSGRERRTRTDCGEREGPGRHTR
eukprot:scaffold24654_cov101-Isochrysis_galbana.AAC.3